MSYLSWDTQRGGGGVNVSVPPDPIARFDFNYYTALSPTIANRVQGQPPATINLPSLNSYVIGVNSYLQLYFDLFPNQCGAITAPTYTFRTLEIWWKYPTTYGGGQYILDARSGAATAYWISVFGAGPDNVGSDLLGSQIYVNGAYSFPLTVTVIPPALVAFSGLGWFQMVIVLPESITDDCTFFCRFSGEQSTIDAQVADIAIYDTALSSSQIKALFNAKCSRYGLSPIP